MNFAPLNVYTSYSFLNSALTVKNICKATKKYNYLGLGICDINSLTGIGEFFNETKSNNLSSIIGETIFIDDYKFSFFVKDETGYRNLIRLNHLSDIKEIDINKINEYFNGLHIVISTDNQKFKDNFLNHYLEFVRYLSNITKGYEIYLGLDSKDELYNQKIREFAKSHSYKLVAFPLIQYINKEDAITIKIVNAIRNDEKLNIRQLSGDNYLLTENELNHLYTKEELDETINIIKSSSFILNTKRGVLPTFINKEFKDSDTYLKELAFKNLKEKLKVVDQKHLDRLNYELDVISSMGYSDYFLIVMDFIKFAKDNGILVGPGRGSAAGSLVSYALDIVKSDPLDYNLMFERFLNKERQTMPDIDSDFMDIRRDEVFEYLKDKYGHECVANIITIQTIGAKQSIRDIGRVFDISTNQIDLLSKTIVDDKLSLRDNYKTNPAFKNLIDSDKFYLEIVKYASKIEGLARQSGLHAAGVVLNKDSLLDIVPTKIEGDKLIVALEKDYLEDQGLLKMDLLGLRNLTVVYNCLNLINSKYHKDLKYSDIPYLDENAIKLIGSAKTMGVFQLESKGMKKSTLQIGVSSFDDIIALISLFRPGPMDFIANYGRRKQGKEKVYYPNKDIENILSNTYGIIVYQEQIMEIVQKVAKFSLGEADLFRRAISKKNSEKLKSLEDSFMKGAIKNNYDRNTAKKIFDMIYKFANYGFNKAHALSYAILSSQMAYLKYYYPKEFYASILENTSANSDSKVIDIIQELKSLNVKIVSPNINLSEEIFSSNENGLVFSLTSIKGISYDIAKKIIDIRNEGGLFKSFEDFIVRISKANINLSERNIISLIDAGCFDLFNDNRKELRANLTPLLEYAKIIQNINLEIFNDTSFIPKPSYISVAKDKEFELQNEFIALGLLLSGTILDKDKIKDLDYTNISDISADTKNYIVGKIISIKKLSTRKDKKPMAFIKIMDDTGVIDVTIFPTLYKDVNRILKENNSVKIKGKIEKIENSDEYSILASEIDYL